MATHSSTLAWRIPWTEEPGRLQSTGSQRVGTWLKWLSTQKEMDIIYYFFRAKTFTRDSEGHDIMTNSLKQKGRISWKTHKTKLLAGQGVSGNQRHGTMIRCLPLSFLDFYFSIGISFLRFPRDWKHGHQWFLRLMTLVIRVSPAPAQIISGMRVMLVHKTAW